MKSARVGNFDGEIGRGRQRNEDDSSRESSPVPRRAPKRSFSPPSDDGDVVVEEEGKGQTPLPAERPIIRQAVAFSDQASQVPIMTYEAKVLQLKKSHFLPGQEVPLLQKQTKKNKGVKKPRKKDAFSGQTSRFRLDTYDPTPLSAPPTTHGNGPYSSLYRNVGPASHRTNTHQEPQAGPSNCVSMGGSSGQATGLANNSNNAYMPSTGLKDGFTSDTGSTIPTFQSENAQKCRQIPPSSHEPTSSSSHSQSRRQIQTGPFPSPRPLSADSHSTDVTDTTLTTRDHSSLGPYYRRNYDDTNSTLSRDRRTISTVTSTNTSTKSSSPDSFSLGFTQVVTLLITDIRSESAEPDHQLAEVKVPLKKADELEAGWWADAKDIAGKLQAGAARIDGPARVFTMRGKYRQFILRVTAENKDEIESANVPVSADRTLALTIELLHPPGVLTRSLHTSMRKWSRTYDNQRSEERMDIDLHRAVLQSYKRRASPSFDDHDGYSDHHSSTGPSKVRRRDRGWERTPRRRGSPLYGEGPTSRSNRYRSWRHSPSVNRGRHRRSHSPEYHSHESPSPPLLARTPLPTIHVGPGRPHREEKNSCESSDEPFTSAVERLLRDDPEVSDVYFKAIASNKVCDIVKQYETVSRMFKKWAGKRPPGFSQPIEEIHIAEALEIDDPQVFISDCKETLNFLKLYGRRGRFIEDPRVVAMLDDTKSPSVNSEPAKKLLRLLRAVDDAWRNDRSGPLLNGIMLPEPSDSFDEPGPCSPEEKSKGPVQSQIANSSPRQPSYVHPSTSKNVAPETDERDTSRRKSMFMD